MPKNRWFFGGLCLAILVGVAPEVFAEQPRLPAAQKNHLTGTPMMQSSLYPIKHANSGRGGAIDALSTATGSVAWAVELAKPATEFWPADILIWQGLPLLSTYDDLMLIGRDGKLVWTRKKQGGTPAAVSVDGNLYYKNPALFLDAIDPTGKQVLKSAPFPGAMGLKVKVLGFWPRAQDFVAVTYDPPPTESRLGPPGATRAPADGPTLTLIRNNYPTPYGDWLHTYSGKSALVPLLIPNTSVVAIVLAGQVVRADVDKQAELPRFKLPVGGAVDWSVDAKEVYSITGYEGGRKVVVAVSNKGDRLWRWEDTKESDTWAKLQPPIRFGNDRVYVLTEGRILAIDSGNLAWAYDLRSEGLRHGANVQDGSFEIKDGRLLAKGAIRHGSVLSDGSLLVTSGRSLFHISSKGSKLFSMEVSGDILSSPVVDDEGKIYVSTATHLIKIQ